MEISFNILINKILTAAAKQKAVNVHLTVGAYPMLRIDDELIEISDTQIITNDFIEKVVETWLSPEQKQELEKNKSVTLVKDLDKRFRIKINLFFQKGFLSAILALIPSQIPALLNLGLPKSVYNLIDRKSGLVIIAGPYCSGRTTTMVAMIEEINKSRQENILTIEKPIEYLLVNKKSLVEQREVGRDTNSFADALKYAQQADIDVIAIGAPTEKEIIPLVLEFANSGRLNFLVMDTTSVVQTIEAIFAVFPPSEKMRAQLLLSGGLSAIIAQRLVPKAGGGLILAAEVLIANEPVCSLISEGKTKQINTILQTSRSEGMSTLDQSLAELVKSGEVLVDKAIEYALNPQNFHSIAKT